MSGGGGGGGGGGSRGGAAPLAAAVGPIPPTARKVVQSLREIVSCSDAEIYAMLKECNMDPNEAVQRLLTQDTFHEVRSKRDKKKEGKDTLEPRPRVASNTSSRGSKGAVDRYGRSQQPSSSDYLLTRGKAPNRRETEISSVPTSSILGSGIEASNMNQKQSVPSGSATSNVMMPPPSLADGKPAPVQISSGFQHSWTGMPGQLSMADIVKMGRPQGKPSGFPISASERSHTTQSAIISNIPNQNPKLPPAAQELDQGVPATNIDNEAGVETNHDDWSVIVEQSESSASLVDTVNLHADPYLDESQEADGDVDDPAVTEREIQVENSENSLDVDDGLSKNINAYESQRNQFEPHDAEDANAEISSAAANFQQLSLHDDEKVTAKSAEDGPAVIIPNHLQVTNADCAHLSFGSFGSGTFSGSTFQSKPVQSSLEVAPITENTHSVEQPDVRNHEYYNDGPVESATHENIPSGTVSSTENREMPSASTLSEVTRTDSVDASHGIQYNLPSVSGYAFSSTSQPNASAYTYPQGNAQVNLSPFSSLMQANTLPTSLLAPSAPQVRDFDLSFSPLLTTQSMPTKYTTAVSSISGASISMPESFVLLYYTFMLLVPITGVRGGFLRTYDYHFSVGMCLNLKGRSNTSQFVECEAWGILQPSVNSISVRFGHSHWPSTPPTSTCPPLPSTIPSSGPVCKYDWVPVSSPELHIPPTISFFPAAILEQRPVSPICGHFTNGRHEIYTATIQKQLFRRELVSTGFCRIRLWSFWEFEQHPGNFSLNPNTALASTTLRLDEALSSQNKDAAHYMSLHQSENPAMWLQGASLKTMSGLPPSTFYSYQAQQGQPAGFRQGPQSSQYGALGYPNFHHAQAGAAQGGHQQSPDEGNLNSSQATAPSQPSHQLWQHSY
uniref:GBF-interacting protein 1 N-terminal domain-containing protein n=1 Tax=Ananas comosus var. bracteatus TaxID=296719 RepID=A0A6V7PTV0_ANACO|nr:unnamed protein product [Ananas comosus var. bracteatus]